MTDDQLEAALRQLGGRLTIPEPPDVTAKVRARLSKPRRMVLRPVLATALAVLLAFALAFAVSPEVRAAVAEFLRFAGIEFSEQRPPSIPVTSTLPGERVVTLEEARQQARFPIQVPKALGEPREVRITDRFVSLLYDNKRIDEFDGDFGPAMEKFARAEYIHPVTVNGHAALWIPMPHEVLYIDRNGEWRHESARMSGKTLIWQTGSVTMRLEGELTEAEAIRIAES